MDSSTTTTPAPTDPPFGLIYGGFGAGKSVDLLRTFPDGLFLSEVGALLGAQSFLGYEPKHILVRTLKELTTLVTERLPKHNEELRKKGLPAITTIVADDFTYIVQSSFAEIEKIKAGTGTLGDSTHVQQFWGEVRSQVLDVRDALRRCGFICFVNCHESPGRVKSGQFVVGGPALSGNLASEWPGIFDLVYRAMRVPERAAESPWPTCYANYGPGHGEWVGKDRLSIVVPIGRNPFPAFAPMNLREILRAAGIVCGRALGLEWQEEMEAKMFEGMKSLGCTTRFDGPTESAALGQYAKQLVGAGKAQPHIRWSLDNVRDRCALARVRGTPLSEWGL